MCYRRLDPFTPNRLFNFIAGIATNESYFEVLSALSF
jgi:hypothetical protein